MMKRSNETIPDFLLSCDLQGIYQKYWKTGCFDDYSADHFLIRLFYNGVESIEWKEQLINNNCNSMYAPIKNGGIDYETLSENFLINLGTKLSLLEKNFGEASIGDFIKGQMAAGKTNYDKDQFFQALSEIEILSFFLSIFYGWTDKKYEPGIGPNGSNPEATFFWNNFKITDTQFANYRINVEVKTAAFPILTAERKKTIIPAVLLTNEGRKAIKEYAKQNNIDLIEPRVTKLVDFINSAAKKFSNTGEGDINLLFINWSYSNFPSNGFLEAWSLLTNEVNGLMINKDLAENLPFEHPVSPDAYEKITAIIVYTNSLEQLMFGDFRDVYKTHPTVGPRFRVFLNTQNLKFNNGFEENHILFRTTGMNPSPLEPGKWRLLADVGTNNNTIELKAEFAKQCVEALEIIDNYILQKSE